jgi:large subunit ribosomal protein L6
MSRIGNNPINIPEGVIVDIQPTEIHVKGKLGELTQDYNEVDIDIEDNSYSIKIFGKKINKIKARVVSCFNCQHD